MFSSKKLKKISQPYKQLHSINLSEHHYNFLTSVVNKDNKPLDLVIADAIQCYIAEYTYNDIVKNGL